MIKMLHALFIMIQNICLREYDTGHVKGMQIMLYDLLINTKFLLMQTWQIYGMWEMLAQSR